MKALKFLLEKIKNGKIVYNEDVKNLILCLIQDSDNVHLSCEDGNLIFDMGDKDLIIEYISRYPLSDNLQLKLFERDDAYELFQKLPDECKFFCEKAEIMMLKHKKAFDFVKNYIKCSSLSKRAEPLLFELENAENLAIFYANKHDFISPISQVKFFQLNIPDEEFELYVRETEEPLCELAELELLKHKKATNLVLSYIENHQLSDSGLFEVLKLNDAYKIMETYIKYGWKISDSVQMKLLDLKQHVRLFELYAKKEISPSIPSICKEAIFKLLDSEKGTLFLKKHYGNMLYQFPEIKAKLIAIA